MSENRTGKYLKYALGEILLVMIGILLALQVNNWNTQRIANKQEISLLSELKLEYEGKQNELSQKVSLRNEVMNNCKLILKHINNKDLNFPLDSLNSYLGHIFITPTFDASNAVTDELINSGKLYLISNKELRSYITSWKAQIDKLKEEEDIIVNLYNRVFETEFMKYYPLNNTENPFFSEESNLVKYFSKNSETTKFEFIKSEKYIDLEKFYKDLEIENLIGRFYLLSAVGNVQSIDVSFHIENTLKLIDSELNNDND